MTFTITENPKNGLTYLTISNQSTNECVEIIPTLGGMVHKLKLQLGGTAQPLLFHDSEDELLENPSFRGRFLFPFNDRIPWGRYTFAGESYQLPINSEADQSSLHGLIYNRAFKEIDQSITNEAGSLTLGYTISSDQFSGYPFSVGLQISYTLKQNCLELQFTIENFEDRAVPIALGWHPYFTLNRPVDELHLKAEADHYVEVDETLIPTRNLPLCRGTAYDFSEGQPLGAKELDIAVSVPTEGITQLSYADQAISLSQDPKFFKYTQLYIPDSRQSIAIEPVSAATNAFNFTELGLIELKAKEILQTYASVTVGSLA